MDRFKFRAWDNEKNIFEYDIENCYDDWNCQNFYDYILKDRYIVEQCTGLKDKNGKLIYEGDILGGIYGGYVSWCDKCKSFELFIPEFDECMACNGDVLWQEIVEDGGTLEVVGNIHENADLLGEE